MIPNSSEAEGASSREVPTALSSSRRLDISPVEVNTPVMSTSCSKERVAVSSVSEWLVTVMVRVSSLHAPSTPPTYS